VKSRERGQASIALIGGLAAIVIGAFVFAAVGSGMAREGATQRAADLAALAGARSMHDAYTRLFEPVMFDHRPNPRHLEKDAYLALARDAARDTARANGAPSARVSFPDGDSSAPVQVEVAVERTFSVGKGEARHSVTFEEKGTAELAPPGGASFPDVATGGGYDGPLSYRQGKPMRPDVAQAFDRLERAARQHGVALLITSAYRSDAEQAALFRAHPDPKWVAPPGTSLHRNATELDLGPPAAYGWLAANAPRFHFIRRYAWEPWHYGYALNAASTPHMPQHESALPAFVPDHYAPTLARAAQRWNVSAALLAAQIYAESNFNPFAESRAGAQGIAQFMPGTAQALGLENPFDAEQAIDAQAHLMRDLLRRFAAVSLALAAYNAGPTPVAACMCVPPYAETRGYVARILGLLGGAGELATGAGLEVRLVE
jgi:soluble lytic murein transglycosylase-like protein